MRSSKPAVILVGHGSRAPGFDSAMKRVAARLRRGDFRSVRCAFLEISTPSIPDALRSAIRQGATEVRVVPYFVSSGRHIRNDIPAILTAERKRWGKAARIVLCPYLGFDERIVRVVEDRIHHGG